MKPEELIVNGVKIAAGDGAEKSFALPSGKRAAARTIRGRDLMRAGRAAEGGGPMAMAFAPIAEVATIDGQRIVYEGVLEMDGFDPMALQWEMLGENFSQPPARNSPGSSGSGSQPEN
ncbi:MAG: hypothetical protein ACREQI_11755 [Candidatus Binataceae bacterium]